MIYEAGDSHPEPALSIVDIISVLYFKILNINPQNEPSLLYWTAG